MKSSVSFEEKEEIRPGFLRACCFQKKRAVANKRAVSGVRQVKGVRPRTVFLSGPAFVVDKGILFGTPVITVPDRSLRTGCCL